MDTRAKAGPITSTLLGPADNRVRNITGAKKAALDLLIARGALEKTAARVLRTGTPPIEAINVIDSLGVIAAKFKTYKYVSYNGRAFLDCFSPKWPGPVFDRMMQSLLDNLGKTGGDWRPIIPSLVFSITKKCPCRCEHCYAVHTLGGPEALTEENILNAARALQRDPGIAVMAWEGGEPLQRFDTLLNLIRGTSPQSESIIATTAIGLTVDKAQQLRAAGLEAAIISLDHYEPDKHNAFRGNKKAYDSAVEGVRIFRENGILPSVCICATRENIKNDGLWRYLELAKSIGAAFVQVLDATPSGSYMGGDVLLSNAEVQQIKDFAHEANTAPRWRDYPAVQVRALLEDEEHYGCCAGNALVYIDSSGNMQGCDLLQISFGNILEEDIHRVYNLVKETFPHSTAGRCPAQTLHKHVAAAHAATGELPVPHSKCPEAILRLKARPMPDHIQKIASKMARKSPADFL